MKLWKIILGIFTFIGGIFALGAVAKKKDEQEFDNQIKENEDQIKKVQETAKKVEEAKEQIKKELVKLKEDTSLTKQQLKNVSNSEEFIDNFEAKYRKK